MKIRFYRNSSSLRGVFNWNKRIKNRNGTVIKIYDKGLAGCVLVRKNWIYSLVVNPSKRNQGYGKKLLKEAENLISKNYKDSYLIPQDNDLDLRDYYINQGYVGFIGNEPGYEEEDKTWWEMHKDLTC